MMSQAGPLWVDEQVRYAKTTYRVLTSKRMNMVLFGYDGSDFSHVMDFSGLSFVTHKATEHAPDDIYYHYNFGRVMRQARDQDVPFIGAYVVPRTGVDIDAQARTAIDFVRDQAAWVFDHPGFFWQVDLEHWGYDDTEAWIGDALCNALENATGKATILYASAGQYDDTIPGSRPLWNANYNGSGASRPFREMYLGDNAPGWVHYSGRHPLILQYCSDAIFADGQVGDANAFRGTEDDFRRLIVNRLGAPTPTPTPSPGGSVSHPPIRVLDGVSLDSVGRKTMEIWRRILPPDLLARLYVTSNFRAGDWDPANGSFHGALDDMGALDIAGPYNGFQDSQGVRDMRDACEYLKPYFSRFKQVIHSTPYNTDNGYYIFDGHESSYGDPNNASSTAGQHRDHVHTAASEGNLDYLLSIIPDPDAVPAPVPVPTPVPDPTPVPTPTPTPVPDPTDLDDVKAQILELGVRLGELAASIEANANEDAAARGRLADHDARLVELEEVRNALRDLLTKLAK